MFTFLAQNGGPLPVPVATLLLAALAVIVTTLGVLNTVRQARKNEQSKQVDLEVTLKPPAENEARPNAYMRYTVINRGNIDARMSHVTAEYNGREVFRNTLDDSRHELLTARNRFAENMNVVEMANSLIKKAAPKTTKVKVNVCIFDKTGKAFRSNSIGIDLQEYPLHSD